MRISSVLAAALFIAACHKEEAAEEPAKVTVRAEAIAACDVADVLELAGPLEAPPGLDVKLAPLAPGRLASVLAAEGDAVRKGQVLARLDPTPLRDAAAQAEAQLAQAAAQETNAKSKLARAEQALAAGVAARQEVDDARLGEESARAAVRSAQAQVSTARNQLARGELRAPFDGVVAKVSAAPGEPVDPGKPVIEVARIDVLELRAPVAAQASMRLRPGQTATVDVEGRRFPATVIAVSPVVDAATGAALARLRVPNEKGALRANVIGRARVTADLHRGVPCVPRAALLGGPEGAAIEVVEGGKAKRVPVRTGYDDGEHVELLEGAAAGQRVIVQGAYALPDGTAVSVEEPPPAGETKKVPAAKAGAEKPE